MEKEQSHIVARESSFGGCKDSLVENLRLYSVSQKKATIRFDSHSAQSYQNSFIFSDIEDIHQEFLLVKFEDH